MYLRKLQTLLFLCFFGVFYSTALQGASVTEVYQNDLSPKETIQFYYQKLSSSNNGEGEVVGVVQNLFDVESLAPMTLSKMWPDLDDYERSQYIDALKVAIQNKIIGAIAEYGNHALPYLQVISETTKGNFAQINYLAKGDRGNQEFIVYMLRSPEGGWRISNIKVDDTSLVRYYFSYAKKILDDYSLPYLDAKLANSDFVILANFQGSTVGEFPAGWKLLKSSDSKKPNPYVVEEEGGDKYLAARDTGQSIIIGKDIKWNLKEYPYISFKWRALALPTAGDERYGKTVDSAAGIYIVYKEKLGLIPESIKYVWSTTLPVGATVRRSGVGKPWMVVAESGAQHLNQWRTYVFNAYEAYKQTFGGDPPDSPVAIGILSDANSTHSRAFADYDDIIALKHANANSGIKEFLQAE